MNKIFLKSKKIYLGISIILAISGSIFFFPMNIEGKYTCFYHRIFNPSHPISEIGFPQHHQNAIQDFTEYGDENMGKSDQSVASDHGSVLLDRYLDLYAFIWWGSVGLLALCIYLFFKLKRNVKMSDTSLTAKK